ncbi:DUF2169 family type VI secretion system accessory protein [Salmonella enterica]|nr:DUF2169 domain-containing protein [Salmonella enterica]EBQ2136644.1 DUF2169 domain-containing protein [Salmonella enterica]EHS6105741.1 DUF2169 domain-containing protein [Salmonella enterica]MIG40842.1 DUF2169 domain-containing protein [Salmonella enterica subsp. enterica]
MDIDNDTGFPHFQFKKVGYHGELFTVVVVNQTFEFSYNNGHCLVAEDQRPPLMTDSWYGEPERSSLKTATDLICKKVRADILLNGHAWYAAGQIPHWRAGFQVGNLNHQFDVCGRREWLYTENHWQLSEPESTDCVPLRHELALFSEFNPVGIRPPSQTSLSAELSCPAPQLSVSPGAICRSWPSRLRYARGFTEEWIKKIQPFYPDEFDFAFMNCAPPGQQYNGYLIGNEKIVLNNILPSRIVWSSQGLAKQGYPWERYLDTIYDAKNKTPKF